MFFKVGYFIKDFWAKYGPFDKVLDVGSLNENGAVRDFIGECREFIGIDMRQGKGVDIVMNGHDLVKKFKPESFDLITCCETLEHDIKFWETVEAMKAVLKKGGWLLVTTPDVYFMRHSFPDDYYRFTESVYRDFIFKGFKDVHIETYFDKADPNTDKPNNTVLGYGRKL